MKRRRSNTLVALSSAAVMTVYTAGFMRTRAAAEKLERASRQRVPMAPAAPVAAEAPVASAAPIAQETLATPTAPVTPQVRVAPPAPKPKRESKPVHIVEPPAAPAIDLPAMATEAAAAPPPVSTPAAAPTTTEPLAPSAEIVLGGIALRDGTYLGWGRSRHGDIQASVTLLSGRITAVSIAQCRTQYSCDIISHLPPRVLKDQTPEKIPNVSGATQSVDAFYYAVVDAINKAK